MITLPKTRIDPTKITGIYPLLGLFLLIVEGLLGFWLFRAQNGVERSVAGLLITLILGAFLLAALRAKEEKSDTAIVVSELGGQITPAEKEATEKEIEDPQPENLASPDRSYSINKPPLNWIVKELTPGDYMSEAMGISDQQLKEKFAPASSQIREILQFQSPDVISIVPIPGNTVADGRRLFSALEVFGLTQLSILPMYRAQPPLFADRPFEHNFYAILGENLRIGLVTLRGVSSGTIPNSGRRYHLAECRQELRNVKANGKETESLNINLTLMGIEGELRDHLLLMSYPSLPDGSLPALERSLETLRSLVSSFRPLKAINPGEQLKEYTRLADEEYAHAIEKTGEEKFFAELAVAVARLSGVDMDDPEIRLKAIRVLAPFEEFANAIKLENQDLDNLWKALHEAERGDASSFKESVDDLIRALTDESPVTEDEETNKSILEIAPPDPT